MRKILCCLFGLLLWVPLNSQASEQALAPSTDSSVSSYVDGAAWVGGLMFMGYIGVKVVGKVTEYFSTAKQKRGTKIENDASGHSVSLPKSRINSASASVENASPQQKIQLLRARVDRRKQALSSDLRLYKKEYEQFTQFVLAELEDLTKEDTLLASELKKYEAVANSTTDSKSVAEAAQNSSASASTSTTITTMQAASDEVVEA